MKTYRALVRVQNRGRTNYVKTEVRAESQQDARWLLWAQYGFTASTRDPPWSILAWQHDHPVFELFILNITRNIVFTKRKQLCQRVDFHLSHYLSAIFFDRISHQIFYRCNVFIAVS